MKKAMIKATAVIVFPIIAALVALSIILFSRTDKCRITLDTESGLSSEHRIKDFKNMVEYIEDNVPFIYDYEELYGISFEDTQEYYYKLISSAEDDFEYYALMQGFINNIPSGHLTLGYPNVNFVNDLYTYRTNDYSEFSTACEYWENLLRTECQKYYDEDHFILPFYYTDGKYIRSDDVSADEKYSGAELVAVDNVPIDEFIQLCPLEYKLKYDHQKQKPFREAICFNDLCGNECMVRYKDKKGNIVSEKMYYGTSGNIVLNYSDYFQSIDEPQTVISEQSEPYGRIYTYYDKANNAVYIKLNDFTYGGAEALKKLDKDDIPDNVIIDLRDNTGGMMSVCDALIEKLSCKSFGFETEIYGTTNAFFYDDNYIERKAADLPFKTHFKKLYIYTRKENFEGKSEQKRNVYVLVSHITLSAADRFASIIKDNGLGKVIGAFNTGGEAYGSPDLKVLEKSGLYFYYTPNKSLNSDGTDNSVYGTSPDIYVDINKSALNKRNNLIVQGIDCGTYENRLKWDNVLIKTLELIKEDENDKGNNTANE